MPMHTVPDEVPILSRGKHRNPRKGACFMELASYLAGERWSDHPDCTHPLLAALARAVNDCTSDAGRGRLAPLIPSVIGLTSDDPHVDVRIALRCARTALPVAAFGRQHALAVAILSAERVLDDLDDRTPGSLEEASRAALADVPHSALWARRYIPRIGASTPSAFRRHAAPRIVSYAVPGIATACISDPDGMLYDLLAGTIEEFRTWVGPATPVDTDRWADACHLTVKTVR